MGQNLKQSGNVLFLILIAVALFVALAYAITSSNRVSTTSISSEAIKSQVAAFQSYGVAIHTALERMNITQDLQNWQIDFSKSGFVTAGNNATCTTSSCKLFDPDGGGATAILMPPAIRDSPTSCTFIPGWGNRMWFRNISIKGTGQDNKADLVLLYPGVSKQFCLALNDANGVINPSGTPPVESDGDQCGFVDYGSTLTQEANIDLCPEIGLVEASVGGKRSFCEKIFSNCYYAYYVLQDR